MPKAANSDNLASNLFQNLLESSFRDSSYYEDSQRKPYNPDDLYQKDFNYQIYEDMMNDDQVSVAMQLKKDLVIGSGWELSSFDDSSEDVIEFIYNALEKEFNGQFEDSLEEILSSYDYGFSITEKVFKKIEENKIILHSLKTRYPDSFLIHTDDKGNIIKYEQRSTKATLEIEPGSIIHYINNYKFQNPYGKSDLRPCYSAWFTKTHILRHYSIFLEKAASPIPVAKYRSGTGQDIVDKIFNIIKKFQSKTAIAIPDSIDLEFLNSGNNGDAYIKGINLLNMFIGRALFIPDLLGFQGGETGGGAFALGKEHMGLFFRHINRRRNKLEKIINKEIIYPMIIWNFGKMEKMPEFKFKPLTDEVAVELAKVWLTAVNGKAYKPSDDEINHFRNLVKFPEGEVERNEAPSFEQKEEFTLKKNYKKLDVKAIEKQLDSTHDIIMMEIEPVVKETVTDLIDQIEKKKVMNTGNIERLESLKLKNLKKLQLIFKQNYKDLFKKGHMIAQKELFSKKEFKEPIPTDEFLEFLEKESYRFIGEWEYRVTSAAKQEIIKALKDGVPLSSVVEIISTQGLADAMTSIERYSRTKETEVMNKARMDFFESTGVVDGYEYNAILDAVTSDICIGLNGKFFRKEDAPIPPMHFNCRSILVPMTQFEDVNYLSGKDLDETKSFIKENIGKGFSEK